jgi:hypothetical protein
VSQATQRRAVEDFAAVADVTAARGDVSLPPAGAASTASAAGEPLFQAAAANLNPWSQAKVNSANPERGPMLIVSADSDHTVPRAIATASYNKQNRNGGVRS